MAKRTSKRMPMKAGGLKVIDHIGTLYATFDGSSLWRIDRAAFNVLRLCDGKTSVESIVDIAAAAVSHRPNDVRPVVEEILENLSDAGFLVWV